MRRMLVISSGARGVLDINGCFCGPVEPCGQAFPTGEDAEIYMRLFPFAPGLCPLTAALILRGGRIVRMEPEDCCYMLLWPDGVMQLELRLPGQEQDMQTGEDGPDAPDLLRTYLELRRMGDPHARELLAAPSAEIALGEYEAVLPLRFAPMNAPGGYDLRAGIVRRLGGNIAAVDAVVAAAAFDAAGRRRIARMAVMCSGE